MTTKAKPVVMEKIVMERSCKQATGITKYGKFNVLSSDYMGKKFISGHHYECDKIEKVLPHLKEGDTVLDVGSNFGIHAIPYAQKIGKSGKLFAFEPQTVIFNLLKDNVEMNCPDHDIQLFHCCVGHKKCTATMNGYDDRGKVLDYHRSQETNYGGLNLGKHGEKVEMLKLDDMYRDGVFGDKGVQYIKIDVEGAEPLVIYGARRLIEDFRPIVFYEENWKKVTKEMIDMFNLTKNISQFNIRDFFMKELGYSKIEKIGSNYLALP